MGLLGTAAAASWWVPTQPEADVVAKALATTWPTSPFIVRVLPAGTSATTGAWVDAGQLHLRDGGRVLVMPAPGDVGAQITMVRAWMREVPELAEPQPWRVRLAVASGTAVWGARWQAPLHAGVGFAGHWRSLVLGASLDGELLAAERGVDGRTVSDNRVAAGAVIGLRHGLWGGSFEATLGLGPRWLVADSAFGTATQVRLRVAERLTWWRAVGSQYALGFGAVVMLDVPRGTVGGFYAPGEATLGLELGFAWWPA